MSYGNRLSIPFTTPSLVVTVLNNQDYQNKGYVWGFDGRLHYCFLDPEKVRFDVWKKRFHWSSLLWLIMNAVALAVSPFVPALLPLAWSLPTVPFALLRHYRCTAKEQVAAIVTNGPQMVYPGNLKTRQMMFGGGATFLGILTLGAMLAPYIPQLSALLLKTFPPGKAVFVKQFMGVLRGIMQVGALRWIAAAGLAINLTAIFLFLLGFLAKPYNWVFGTKIKDLTGKMRTWFHLGRSATSFASYRIAPEQPSGLPWGCGGLIPIINNGVISSKKESLGVLNVNYDVVVWGLLPFVGDIFWSKF